MGAGGSKSRAQRVGGIVIPPSVQTDMDKLSEVVRQILAKGVLYNFNNLARPGVCGDYALFLKKDIEKQLLSFTTTVDVSGGGKKRLELVYQNPRQMLPEADRKAACSSLATAMIRLAATVVACLASIQVASSAPPIQRGGGIPQIRAWLVANGYIATTDAAKPAGEPIEIHTPGVFGRAVTFQLVFRESEDILTHASISATGARPGEPPMPAGSLKLDMLNPIRIPGTDAEIMPVRITDSANLPWLVGVLYKGVFKSLLDTNPPMPFLDFVELFFRKTQGPVKTSINTETRDQLAAINEIFRQYRRNPAQPAILFQPISAFLQTYAGLPPTALGAYGGPGVAAPAYPGAPAAPAYPGAAPAYSLPPRPGAAGPLIQLRPPTLEGAVQYDIPLATSKAINDTFKFFMENLQIDTSPAVLRAWTLRAIENPDRTITTGVCKDRYWSQTTLGKVYPWAAFQFLCVKKWENIAESKPEGETFEPEWLDFVRTMATEIYPADADSTLPSLDRLGGGAALSQMRFKDVRRVPVCMRSDEPRVNYRAVQDGILSLQGIYDRHVRSIWSILNNLIVVFVDPDTKQEVVKIHPAALRGDSTEAYVNEWAGKARALLRDFYLDVERAYTAAVEELEAV